jgi:serine/threonine protein kinase
VTDFVFPPVVLIGHGLKVPQYSSLNTLLSPTEPHVERKKQSCEAEKQNLWSIGCIFYELSTGYPAFPDFSSLLKYQHGQFKPDYTLIGLNPKLQGKVTLSKEEQVILSSMWSSVRHLSHFTKDPDCESSGFGSSRVYQMETTIKGLLDLNSDETLSVKLLELHCSVNVIRSKLCEDKVLSRRVLPDFAGLFAILHRETDWTPPEPFRPKP